MWIAYRLLLTMAPSHCRMCPTGGCLKWITTKTALCTGDPLHSRAACTQPCNVNTHSRAHCSPGARLCEQWGHGCVNNGARLCASARLCRGSPVILFVCRAADVNCITLQTHIQVVGPRIEITYNSYNYEINDIYEFMNIPHEEMSCCFNSLCGVVVPHVGQH